MHLLAAASPPRSVSGTCTKTSTALRSRVRPIDTVSFFPHPSSPATKCHSLSSPILPTVNATAGYIWSHIEPNCSVIAACLPTYGPFFTGGRSTDSLFKNLRSFLSLGSRSSSSSSKGSTGVSSEGKGGSSIHSGQMNSGDAYANKATAAGGQKGHRVQIAVRPRDNWDLEAQETAPMEVAVTRSFGTESRQV